MEGCCYFGEIWLSGVYVFGNFVEDWQYDYNFDDVVGEIVDWKLVVGCIVVFGVFEYWVDGVVEIGFEYECQCCIGCDEL